jgi:hypothetical protein
MDDLLHEDPEADLDPWDTDMEVDYTEFPPLTFARRQVWARPKESPDQGKVDRADERKSVAKGADKHQPVSPKPRTNTKVKVAASVQPPVVDMDVDDLPIVEAEPTGSSSHPPPPSNPRRSVRLHSASPGPSSAVSGPISQDVDTNDALHDIEEEEENTDDKTSSTSNAIDLLDDSQMDSDRELPISPFTLFPHTFPQLFHFLRTIKVFTLTIHFIIPKILIKSVKKGHLKLTLNAIAPPQTNLQVPLLFPSSQRNNLTDRYFSFSDARAKKRSKGKARQLAPDDEELEEDQVPLPPASAPSREI